MPLLNLIFGKRQHRLRLFGRRVNALENVAETLKETTKRKIDGVDALLQKFCAKQDMIVDYTKAYQHYCWPMKNVDDLTLAPFHILATCGY